jgi:signal peptidase I
MSRRDAAHLAGWTALGVLAGVLLTLTVPRALGKPVLVVLTGSMEPQLSTGDVVIESRISPLDAKVGDVITFRDPERPDRLITHRVRRVTARAEDVSFTTKGDANNTVETWQIPRHGSIARVEYRLPKLGYVVAWISGPAARLFLVVIPAILLGLFELRRIWFPRESRAEG